MKKQNKQLVSIVLLYDKNLYRNKNNDPAALLYINKKRRLIDYHISAIKNNFTKYEIIICTGYKSGMIVDYVNKKYPEENIRFIENQLYNQTNSNESVRLALNNINNNNVLVISNLSRLTNSMFIERNQSKVYLMDIEKHGEVGVNIGIDGRVEYMCFGGRYAWTGAMWINNKKTISKLKSTLSNDIGKNKLWFEAINELVNSNTKITSEIIRQKEKVEARK